MKKLAMLTAPFVQEMIQATTNMYRLGWDERNGGEYHLFIRRSASLTFYRPYESFYEHCRCHLMPKN